MPNGMRAFFYCSRACQAGPEPLKRFCRAVNQAEKLIYEFTIMRKRTYQYGDQSLQATFAGIIRDKDWETKFDQHRVFLVWSEIVDSETGAHARPLKIVNDVLWVEVDNSAWVQQLQFKKLELLDLLNHHLRVSYFTDIRCATFKLDLQTMEAI